MYTCAIFVVEKTASQIFCRPSVVCRTGFASIKMTAINLKSIHPVKRNICTSYLRNTYSISKVFSVVAAASPMEQKQMPGEVVYT